MNKERFSTDELNSVLQGEDVDVSCNRKNTTGIGSYRSLYREFGKKTWDFTPARTIKTFFEREVVDLTNKSVAEFGAGTGKNIVEFVRRGVARAVAVEIDSIAAAALLDTVVRLEEGGYLDEGLIAVYKDDVRRYLHNNFEQFDIVVGYGLLHVFEDPDEQIELIDQMCAKVKNGGYIILQSLTDKFPAPVSQPELSGISVKEDFFHNYFDPKKNKWEIRYFDNTDIQHSHAGAEDTHRHGSIRMICKNNL